MPRARGSSADRSPAFDDWVHDARSVPILTAAQQRGARVRGGREKVGPCPSCGGHDRFGINPLKGIFHCRGSGKGGDVIALVQYLDGVDFLQACELLTGRPAPRGESQIDPQELARKTEERRRKAAEQEVTAARYREQERRTLYGMWREGRPVPGTAVEAYLALRQVVVPPGGAVRCLEAAKLYASGGKKAAVIYTGPAMMAAIVGPDDRFAGLHLTWIDLHDKDGKARVADPETGELEPAKKVRGSQTGGRIELVRCERPQRLVLGEGIEEVLSVYRALLATGWDLTHTAFWAAVNLHNLGGAARGSIEHPTVRLTNKAKREQPWKIASDVPDLTVPAIPVPESVSELVLLGDGDSDRVLTETTLRRAARRYARRDRVIRAVWSPAGSDWNGVLRGAA